MSRYDSSPDGKAKKSEQRARSVRKLRSELAAVIAWFAGLEAPRCMMPGPDGRTCDRPWLLSTTEEERAGEFDHAYGHPPDRADPSRRKVVRRRGYDQRIADYWAEFLEYLDGNEERRLRLACRPCNARYNPKRHAAQRAA